MWGEGGRAELVSRSQGGCAWDNVAEHRAGGWGEKEGHLASLGQACQRHGPDLGSWR